MAAAAHINEEITKELHNLAEPKFQRFSSALIPNIPPESVIGVRLPKLRKMAEKIVRSDWRCYLENARDTSFEEIMLQGMVIGCAKAPLSEILVWVENFVPKINNWSVCDSFCTSLKIARDYPQELWEFVQPYVRDGSEYHIRFGVVMLLMYYVDESYIEKALSLLNQVRHESYYVKMAVAWAISMYYVSFPDIAGDFLKDCRLDDFTFNKTLQKIIESKQVDDCVREKMRSMKRKN